MNTKTPECWSSDPNAHGVKIELSSERSLLLPFDQFAFAELKTEGKQQHLRLVFATHEVLIRGNALRRLEFKAQPELRAIPKEKNCVTVALKSGTRKPSKE